EAARHDDAREVAMTGQRLIDAQQSLPQPSELRAARVEADPGTDVPEVADVVVEALELREDCAQLDRPGRRVCAGDPFDRVGERRGVRDRADATAPFDDGQRAGDRTT